MIRIEETGRHEEALAAAEALYAAVPTKAAPAYVRCLRAVGETDRARKVAIRHTDDPRSPEAALAEAYLRAVAGDEEGAVGALARDTRTWVALTAFTRARIHAVLGQTDRAFEWLEKAIELGYRRHPNLAPDPDLAVLASDPRWPDLERRMR